MADYNQVFQEALMLFNSVMKTNFNTENIMLCICVPKNFKSKREQFITEFSFEASVSENKSSDNILGEAFLYGSNNGISTDGIIIIENKLFSNHYELMHVFLHELSHIYCVKNEITSGHFYDEYCSDTAASADNSIENGYYYSGYAIWREVAAEILSSSILPPIPFGVDSVIANYKYYDESIVPFNSASKDITSDLLVKLAFTEEAAIYPLDEFLESVKNSSLSFIYRVLKIVMLQLNQEPFYKINSEFIFNLGAAYITMLTKK